MTTPEHDPTAKVARIQDFIDRYTVWMNEVSAAGHDPGLMTSLTDLMKQRLAADLDSFIETELRLRAFERRAPEQHPLLQLIGNAG